LKEIMDIFPFNIIHIGGDEVLKNRWRECPNCQLRLEEEGFKDVGDLQAYFTNRITNFLNSFRQKVICWNVKLNKNLVGEIILQYWLHGKKNILNHIKERGDVIMSNFKYTYLDHTYSFTPLKLAYKFEPVPRKLEKKYHKHILGLEALMWGEYIPDIKRLEWQTFPRLIAFAEIGWTPKDKKNYRSFHERLDEFLKRLDTIGINYANSKEVKPNVLKRLFKVFTLPNEKKGGT
ncbi:MAG: family 20 glycosylhydrolase, partial [Promethearchaeota archaeon]